MEPDQFHRISKALADPTRLEILERIAAEAGEVACASLTHECAVTQATISHHLKELINAGLIESRWESKFCFYRLQKKVWTEYVAELTRRVPARRHSAKAARR